METAEKLPKHLNTAVNAIQKQIDKYAKQRDKLLQKAEELHKQGIDIALEIDGLKDQIAKIKGE